MDYISQDLLHELSLPQFTISNGFQSILPSILIIRVRCVLNIRFI